MSLRLSNSYFPTRTGENTAQFNDGVKLLHLWLAPAAQFCARVSLPDRDLTAQSTNIYRHQVKDHPCALIQLGEEKAGLTMDTIAQVIHECETCAAIKQAKRLKPLWYGGRWLKYKYGEAWQIDYITLPQTRQGKRHVLTMVEATTGWLETYPVPHATARNTILGLEKQILWRHGTPERIESCLLPSHGG